jgi:radical SAM superfamily enzyme
MIIVCLGLKHQLGSYRATHKTKAFMIRICKHMVLQLGVTKNLEKLETHVQVLQNPFATL